MSWFARLRNLVRSDRVSEEIDREMAFHLAERVDDLVATGAQLDAARQEARRRFGNLTSHRESTRDRDVLVWLDTLLADLRYAVRTLRSAPGFAVVAIMSIALGIGASTTTFAAINGILLRPLPFARANELAVIRSRHVERGVRGSSVSWADYAYWRDANRTFADLGVWSASYPTLSGADALTERVDGAQVSANVFPLLGLRPMIGRAFGPNEAQRDNRHFVVLGADFWRRRYGGDSTLLGKTIVIDGAPHVALGIMPPGAGFPEGAQLWTPLVSNAPDPRHINRRFGGAIGRLKSGESLTSAQSDLATLSARLSRDFPADNAGWDAEVVSLRNDLVGALRKTVIIFLGAAFLVLLIACANVANLLLARGAGRQHEMGIRMAIGASRGRITRQLLTESITLGASGGALGVLVAVAGVRLLALAFPDGVASYVGLSVDPFVLGFAVVISVLAGVIFGLAPAVRATYAAPGDSLRAKARETRAGSRLRDAFAVAEVALSLVLLIGAALLVRSGLTLEHELGFDARGVVSFRVPVPFPKYVGAARTAFYDRLFERVRAIPGVVDVSSTPGGAPLALAAPYARRRIISVDGRVAPANDATGAIVHELSAGYFRTMRIPLARGRDFAVTDGDSANPVAIVNEAFVTRYFGTMNPIGKRVRWSDLMTEGELAKLGVDSAGERVTIVGVAANFRQERPPAPIAPAMYLYRPFDMGSQTLAIRTTLSDPLAIVPPVRAIVQEMDASLPVYLVQTLEHAVARGLWRQRMQSSVLGLFAAIALVLAIVGVYGVISYSVAQRTRELGVRVALGATRRDVLALVLGQGSRLAMIGVSVGIVGALAASRSLGGLLYGVDAPDPPTFIGVSLALLAIAALAAVVPARRAATVDPTIAMRAE